MPIECHIPKCCECRVWSTALPPVHLKFTCWSGDFFVLLFISFAHYTAFERRTAKHNNISFFVKIKRCALCCVEEKKHMNLFVSDRKEAQIMFEPMLVCSASCGVCRVLSICCALTSFTAHTAFFVSLVLFADGLHECTFQMVNSKQMLQCRWSLDGLVQCCMQWTHTHIETLNGFWLSCSDFVAFPFIIGERKTERALDASKSDFRTR